MQLNAGNADVAVLPETSRPWRWIRLPVVVVVGGLLHRSGRKGSADAELPPRQAAVLARRPALRAAGVTA